MFVIDEHPSLEDDITDTDDDTSGSQTHQRRNARQIAETSKRLGKRGRNRVYHDGYKCIDCMKECRGPKTVKRGMCLRCYQRDRYMRRVSSASNSS